MGPNGLTPPDLSGFGPLHVIRPLPGGHRNAVWLVQDPRGGLFVAKSTGHDLTSLAWLFAVQHCARQAGFKIPPPLMTREGTFCHAGWALEAFVTGRPARQSDLAQLVSRLRQFHRLSADLPQRPGSVGCVDLLNVDRGRGVDMAALPPPVAAACRAAWRPFVDAVQTAIHGDIGCGNVILTPEGPALIDWDEARRDLNFLDLAACQALTGAQARAHVAWEIACGWRYEQARAQALAQDFLQNPSSPDIRDRLP